MILRALFLACVTTLCATSARADVLVFAAASLKQPVDRIAAEFGDVVVSYGGSGTIARQVSLGAPADVVLLANVTWMDVLAENGDVDSDTVADFASNRLVLIGQAGQGPVPLDGPAIAQVLGDGRIALGLTSAVPAGIYAKEALQSLGLWQDLAARLAETDNVRTALGLVARGQVPLGIVYRTDVAISDQIAEVALFPQASHTPIRYVGALTQEPSDVASAFWDYLRGPEGQKIMASAGFLPAWSPDE